MAMVPENPVVGGTVLRRAAIQSPNYVAGVSGWIIKQDGSVEFNNGTFRGTIIGGQLFIYTGVPMLGNPPILAVTSSAADPFGNPVSPLLSAGNLAGAFTHVDSAGRLSLQDSLGLTEIILDPNLQAMLVYQNGAASGNLIGSISGSSGTDAFGQPFLNGVCSYNINIVGKAIQMAQGVIAFFNSTGAGQPWTAAANLSSDGVGDLVLGPLASQSVLCQGLLSAGFGMSWSGGATGDKLALSRAGGAPLLEVDNTQNASTPTVRVKTLLNGVQQLAYACLATTDTNARITVGLDPNGNGRLNAGSGAAAPDVALFRGLANLWAADDIAWNNAAAAETWNAVTFGPAGWVNTGTGPGMQFKRVAAPDNSMAFIGRITVPAGFVAGQTVFSIGSATYHPANPQSVIAVNTNTGGLVRFQYGTGGAFVYQSGGNAAGNVIDIPESLISINA